MARYKACITVMTQYLQGLEACEKLRLGGSPRYLGRANFAFSGGKGYVYLFQALCYAAFKPSKGLRRQKTQFYDLLCNGLRNNS